MPNAFYCHAFGGLSPILIYEPGVLRAGSPEDQVFHISIIIPAIMATSATLKITNKELMFCEAKT
jgi:hypothetical protein